MEDNNHQSNFSPLIIRNKKIKIEDDLFPPIKFNTPSSIQLPLPSIDTILPNTYPPLKSYAKTYPKAKERYGYDPFILPTMKDRTNKNNKKDGKELPTHFNDAMVAWIRDKQMEDGRYSLPTISGDNRESPKMLKIHTCLLNNGGRRFIIFAAWLLERKKEEEKGNLQSGILIKIENIYRYFLSMTQRADEPSSCDQFLRYLFPLIILDWNRILFQITNQPIQPIFASRICPFLTTTIVSVYPLDNSNLKDDIVIKNMEYIYSRNNGDPLFAMNKELELFFRWCMNSKYNFTLDRSKEGAFSITILVDEIQSSSLTLSHIRKILLMMIGIIVGYGFPVDHDSSIKKMVDGVPVVNMIHVDENSIYC